MVKVIKIDENNYSEYRFYFDESCITEKVVNITKDCPKATESKKAILLFTTKDGYQVVQISRPYPGEVFFGSYAYFHICDLNQLMRAKPPNDTFGFLAEGLGLSKEDFRTLIEKQVPLYIP